MAENSQPEMPRPKENGLQAADHAEPDHAPDQQREITLGKAMVLLGFQAIGMIAIGGLLWDWSGREKESFVTLSAPGVVQGLALGGVLIAIALALFRGFPRLSEKLVRMQADTYAFLGPKLGMPAIVFISLCAGVGEEALFRGGLQTFLGDEIGAPPAIMVSSALFAVIHLGKPVITALLLVVGAIFGVVFWITESLLAVMIGHTLYDIWALRYLHREFVRLGLVGDEPALANHADAV